MSKIVGIRNFSGVFNSFTKAQDYPIGTIVKWQDGNYVKLEEGKWKKLPPQLQHLTKLPKEMEAIVNSKETPEVKLNKLVKLGITNTQIISAVTGEPPSKIIDKTIKEPGKKLKPGIVDKLLDSITDLPKPGVKDRWNSYELYCRMVFKGLRKGLIAYGIGGVGKTFTVLSLLKDSKMVEYDEEMDPTPDEYDFIKISGKSTAAALYMALYEHNRKLIIFDDCDSVLKDPDGINILKGALDTSGDGTITWASASPMKDSKGEYVPQRFKFKGRVIFISNIPRHRMLEPMTQPLVSRSLSIDLTMNSKETMDRLKEIKYKIPFQDNYGEEIEVENEYRDSAINFLEKHMSNINIGNLNARVLGSIALIKKDIEDNPELYEDLNWEQAALNIIQ